MIFIPSVGNAAASTWRRALRIALGAAAVCMILLLPLLHYVADADWAFSIGVASAAGIGSGAMILLVWGTQRATDWLLARIAPGSRRPRRSANAAAARAQMAATLDAVEAAMRSIGYWQADPPDLLARVRSGELKSYLDAPSFELWLQCVFLPNARAMVRDDQLPPSSSVGVFAMRQYDYHSHVEQAQGLLRLLNRFDAQANQYVGHDPLAG